VKSIWVQFPRDFQLPLSLRRTKIRFCLFRKCETKQLSLTEVFLHNRSLVLLYHRRVRNNGSCTRNKKIIVILMN